MIQSFNILVTHFGGMFLCKKAAVTLHGEDKNLDFGGFAQLLQG